MNRFTALKNFSPFHFTSLHSTFYFILFLFLYFFYLSHQPFTSLHFTLLFVFTTHFPSRHFPSLFTFYRLHFPSLVFTFLSLALKICILAWEVPIAPSGSLFPSVMVLPRIPKGVFPYVCSLFCGSDFPIMIDST
jgi:hypothetical protein